MPSEKNDNSSSKVEDDDKKLKDQEEDDEVNKGKENERSIDDDDEDDSNDKKTHESNDDDKKKKGTSFGARFCNFLAISILVWIGQAGISVALKKYGFIDQDLNERISQRILEDFPGLSEKIQESLDNPVVGHLMSKNERSGYRLATKFPDIKTEPKHPIIIIPGFVSSGLEVWDGDEKCVKGHFRERIWGHMSGAKQVLTELECVLQHLSLNMITGSDPTGIRIRPAQGFEAADYFMANYWVWGKIIENLADVGYDPSNMSLESYDWRLANQIMEQRDGFFTRLKMKIEANTKVTSMKTIIMSHSLSAITVHYFFAWVTTPEEQGGGGGGERWVDENIHTYVNIAGAQLGLPKAATALLSGEFSETVLPGTLSTVVEKFMGRKMRRDLWASWGSLWSMLPKGGNELWNYHVDTLYNSSLPNVKNKTEEKRDYTPFITMTDDPVTLSQDEIEALSSNTNEFPIDDESVQDGIYSALRSFAERKTHSTEDIIKFLLDWGAGLGPKLSSSKLHSFFDDHDNGSNRTWHDLTKTPLPYAPNMKIYCLYGVGKDTERSYYYKRNKSGGGGDDNKSSPVIDPPYVLDMSVEDPDQKIVHGIRYSDGDGSVPLLSLGYLCADGWRGEDSKLNPSGAKVISREYKHEQQFQVDDPMRGGPRSSEHVDILGHVDMLDDLMKIVTGRHDEDGETEVESDLIVSDIRNIARRINEYREKKEKNGEMDEEEAKE